MVQDRRLLRFLKVPEAVREEGYEACLAYIRTPRRPADKEIRRLLDIYAINDRVRDERTGAELTIIGYALSLDDHLNRHLIILADYTSNEFFTVKRETLRDSSGPFRRSIYS